MSPLHSMLFFLIFYSSQLFLGRAATIRIGVLIIPDSPISREQRVALEIAVQDFNSSNYQLSLNFTDSSSNVEGLVNKWGANAIISTLPLPQFENIGTRSKVPLLSLSTYQPLPLLFSPYIFQLPPTASEYTQCLADLVKLFNWKQVILVFEEEDEYYRSSSSIIPLLNDEFLAVGSEISTYTVFPPLNSVSNPQALISQELKKLNSRMCKVFVIVKWSSSSLATDLFKEASALGMMKKGNVWIAGDDITTLVDSSFTSSDISSYMQGVIGIKPYLRELGKNYLDFSMKFQQSLRFKPGMHALKAYDTVRAISSAGKIEGKSLLEGMKLVDFIGLSSRIQFKTNKKISVYQVVNIVGRSYREMGLWSKRRGFYNGEKEKKNDNLNLFGTIYWPGGEAEKTPGGWRKLRIGIPKKGVFNKFVDIEYDNKGLVKDITGFCIDVFQKARDLLNYELPYEFLPFIGTYDQLVASIPEKFDSAVGDISIVSKRMANATFTEPYLPSMLSRVVPLENRSKKWVLTEPFSRKVWSLVALSYIYTCATVGYLERQQNSQFRHLPWRHQIGDTLWLIFCTIFFVPGKIHSYYAKAVIAVWLFVLLILTTTFTAMLSTILITDNFVPIVNDQKVGCDGASFVVKYLEDVLGYKDQRIARVENYDISFQSGEITTAYLETPYLNVFLSQFNTCRYIVYGDTLRLGGLGFAFSKNSPLAYEFSRAILQLLEDGTLNTLEEKWFSQSLVKFPNTCTDKTRTNIDVESLWVLFLLTGAASTTMLILYKIRHLASNSCRTMSRSCVQLKSLKSQSCVQLKSLKSRSCVQLKSLKRRRVEMSHNSFIAPKHVNDSHEDDNLPNQSNNV